MAVDEHLFRREAGRMVAALTRVFGVHNLALAEDVVQDALCRALEVWKFRGVPDNPSAWLMAAAKNRALDVLRRERTARTFAPEVGQLLESEWTLRPTLDSLLEPEAIRDDELRMMFSCCHPRLPEEAQIVLILQILCGFRAREIAAAFLSTPAAIEKRIARGKKALAGSKTLFDLHSGEEFQSRLLAVQRALYLLFNEGYHGASEAAVRSELCEEAIRLVLLLLEHPPAAVPGTYALGALMCFHAARLPARLDAVGALIPLPQQDRSLWDQRLLSEGKRLIDLSARGSEITDYHVEAAIASVHAMAKSFEETRWDRIVALYDTLLRLRSSPVVELQRALAVAEVEGPERALSAIRAIEASDRLRNYPFYFGALGELELRSGNPEPARRHFRAALGAARNGVERTHFEARIRACGRRVDGD
ncbi:MAG: sigma-70 family RNA polymerase sigma factor [Myxococcota bacterium]|nr:sigma-70 family RNA polymerase sigma factor [Myxococcota bacterium]